MPKKRRNDEPVADEAESPKKRTLRSKAKNTQDEVDVSEKKHKPKATAKKLKDKEDNVSEKKTKAKTSEKKLKDKEDDIDVSASKTKSKTSEKKLKDKEDDIDVSATKAKSKTSEKKLKGKEDNIDVTATKTKSKTSEKKLEDQDDANISQKKTKSKGAGKKLHDTENIEVKETKKTQSKAATKKLTEDVDGSKKNTKSKASEKKGKDVTKETNAKPKASGKTAQDKGDSALHNQTSTNWESIDFSTDQANRFGVQHNFKITSWNVGGIRSWLNKGGLNIFQHSDADVICLQEIKCSDDKLPDEIKEVSGYHRYTCSSDKAGYAGVAVYSKIEAIDVLYGIGDNEHDTEGRCIAAEFEKFYVVCVYVPNAGRGLVTLDKRLEWNELFKKFIKSLDKTKPVIIAGDMNVAHNEIDLKNPKSNKKNAGFTPEEREGMTDFLSDGYVDTFRNLYPDQEDAYTFWSYMSNARAKNVGWRLDYFTVSNRLMDSICDNVIHKDVYGSDHCPLSLFLHI